MASDDSTLLASSAAAVSLRHHATPWPAALHAQKCGFLHLLISNIQSKG